MTDPFRRRGAASPLTDGEARVIKPARRVQTTAKTTLGPITWLGAGCSDGETKEAERPARRVRAGQELEPAYYRCGLRPEGTDRERTGQLKPVRGKVGGRGCAMNGSRQTTVGSADEATQGGEAQRDFTWVEASIRTERMLSALGDGVKGGKWFSLMDKVFAPKTLAAAWTKVRSNKGAAGVDGQSIERFAAKAENYLAELSRRTRGDSLACAVADLNPLLRGWFSYFKHAAPPTFGKLDGFVRRRLCAACASRKAPGQGLPRRPSTLAKCLLRGSRAVRASHGLVIGERVSDEKPPTGEPYARKPPIRLGGGVAKADPYPYQ